MALLKKLQAWTSSLSTQGRRRAVPVRRRVPLWLEELEPRVTPSTGYYVDSLLGSDSNLGTSQAQPWKTMVPVQTRVSNGLGQGDQILFKGGQPISGNLVFGSNVNGALGNHVTVGSYGTGPATINAINPWVCIWINNASYITVSNLTINAHYDPTSDSGNAVMINGSNVTLSNLTINARDFDAADTGNGILLNNSSNITLSNIVLAGRAVGVQPPTNLGNTGIFFSGTGSNITIDNVDVSYFGGIGISFGVM